ncbi:MAG TPA: ABC transporter permease [Blastocatellia bacterium]|nr:ABC transporter permease [Blastocatellia bacterium]
MQNLLQDLKYGIRILAMKPAFTVVAVLTLALGIGANTAIFSIVNAVLIRPLPYPHSERLVQAYWQRKADDTDSLTSQEIKFWKERTRSFEDVATYAFTSATGAGFNLAGGAEPTVVQGMRMSANFLHVIGVEPARGRGISAEEDRRGGPCVAVVTDNLWKNYFGANPAVIGKEIRINDNACTLVGVMPAGFQFESPADVFIPISFKADGFDEENTDMIARLKPGVTLKQAQDEVVSYVPEYLQVHPPDKDEPARVLRLSSYRQSVIENVNKVLWLLFGAVGFVLLIACANVANLLLARSTNRTGEMAVRIALGASRGRLLRQIMTENFLLALAGSCVGLLIALWSVPALITMSPTKLPRASSINLDWQSVAFAILAAFVTSILFGIVPALQASRIDINGALKEASGRSTSSKLSARVRTALIVGEVAVSLVLLVGATLLMRSFINLRRVELGFDPENVTALQVSLNSDRYKTINRTWDLERQVIEKISAIPGVIAVGTVPSVPMERGLRSGQSIAGTNGVDHPTVQVRTISPGYFQAVGIKTLRGTTFTDEDLQTAAPKVVINETLARKYWPNADPVGRPLSDSPKSSRIIGIVGDIKEMGLDQPVLPTIYLPLTRLQDETNVALNRWFLTSWIVRTAGPQNIGPALRKALKEVDPELPVAKIRPMTEIVSASLAEQRFETAMMTAFAALALLLTGIGLYGVLSYQVSQRTSEIGLRLALGARTSDVIRMVVKHGLMLTGIGLVIGVIAARLLVHLISSFLFGIQPTDFVTFTGISVLLAIVSLLACAVPALRASKVDPLVALRYE